MFCGAPGERRLKAIRNIELVKQIVVNGAVPVHVPDGTRLLLRGVPPLIVEQQGSCSIIDKMELMHIDALSLLCYRNHMPDIVACVQQYRAAISRVQKGQHVFSEHVAKPEVEGIVLATEVLDMNEHC